MAIDYLKPVARYLRDLLNYDEGLIAFGRDNYEPKDIQEGSILIDYLTAVPFNRQQDYDGVTEIMTYRTKINAEITLDFYGDTGFFNANKFISLSKSERSRQLQQQYQVTIFAPLSTNNLRKLVGTNQRERIEVTFNAWILSVQTEPVLRIDTVQLDEPLVN